MQLAITNHAVERFKERVVSADALTDDAVRAVIKMRVEAAFLDGAVMDHPGFPERRLIPFQAGQDDLVLALGPNDTKFPGEWAVIGVLHSREIGRKSSGATLGDLVSDKLREQLMQKVLPQKTQFLVRIGGSSETYDVKDEEDLEALLARRKPKPEDVEIFERKK
jgi:hypothetical protein